MRFVTRFLRIVSTKGAESEDGKRCLILDDSLLPKRGRRIEKVSRLWDHVTHRSLLGLRLLLMCYYDGKSTIPVDFSLHREKGQNKKMPYGLKKKHLKEQYKKDRSKGSEGYQRVEAGKAEQDNQHEKPASENDFVKQPGILFREEQNLEFPYQWARLYRCQQLHGGNPFPHYFLYRIGIYHYLYRLRFGQFFLNLGYFAG